MPNILETLVKLPVSERIQLVEDLWGSIAEDSLPPLSEAQIAEIERRAAEMEADPSIGIPWEQVRDRLIANQP